MEIKELSFMENLSDNDKKTSTKDSVIGGHSYDYSYSSDYYDYSDHPFFEEIIIDFDFGKIVIEVPQAEPEPRFAFAIGSGAGVPDFPF